MASLYSVFVPLVALVALPAQSLLLPPEAQTPASTPNGGVHIGDYDQDGSVDFTIGSDLYRGDGSGRFVPTTIRGPVTGYVSTTGPVASVDLDQDGDLDFVYVDGVWMNNAGVYVDETAARIGATLSAGAQIELVYDADGDGDLDLVASYYTGVSYYSLYLETALNDGTGNFSTKLTRYLAGGSSVGLDGLIAGDFDGTGTDSLAFSGYWADIGASGMFGGVALAGGGFKPGSQAIAGKKLHAVADLDADGVQDIVATANTGTVGYLGGVTPVTVGPQYGDVWVGDFDGNGAMDCLARSQVSLSSFVLSLNDGAANFTTVSLQIPASPNFIVRVAVGDLDRDGDADIVASATPQVVRSARQQLSAPATASLLSSVPFAVHAIDASGPLSGFAAVAVSLVTADVAVPAFGTLLLAPNQLLLLPVATIAGGQGATSFVVPNLPGLVGMDLYAQSLIDDSGMRLRLSNRTATRIQ